MGFAFYTYSGTLNIFYDITASGKKIGVPAATEMYLIGNGNHGSDRHINIASDTVWGNVMKVNCQFSTTRQYHCCFAALQLTLPQASVEYTFRGSTTSMTFDAFCSFGCRRRQYSFCLTLRTLEVESVVLHLKNTIL